MSKYRTLSLHYLHHPQYVLEIHEKLINLLNQQTNFKLNPPVIKKIGILGLGHLTILVKTRD